MEETVNEMQVGFGKVGMPVRLAITGTGQSPDMGEIMAVLGRDKCIARLDRTIEYLKKMFPAA